MICDLHSSVVSRITGVQVLVRDARAFSCVGSGVDDLRLVHATGEGVERLPDSSKLFKPPTSARGKSGQSEGRLPQSQHVLYGWMRD